MACRDSRGREIFLLLVLFVFATSLCHCASLAGLKAQDEPKENLNVTQNQASPQHRGRFHIGRNSHGSDTRNESQDTEHTHNVETDYQADMGLEDTMEPTRQDQKADMAAVERLLKLEPKVKCTVDSMMLEVQDAPSTPAALFFVDRGYRLSPLPLSKLPPSCGYTIRSTQRELVLVAPYDGCFVALEENNYVLPLRWRGLPVRMSCPLIRQPSANPPMVSCHADGMVVKTEWTISVSRIKVNLTGNWEPLKKASQRCHISIIEHPEGVVISVQYRPCLEKKDGLYTLELAGDGEIRITCPSLLAPQPAIINIPVSTPSPDIQTTGKAGWQTHYHFPFYAQLPTHESPPVQPPLPPKHPDPPERPPGNQEENPLNPFLFYPAQSTSEAPLVESLPTHSPYIANLPEKHKPFQPMFSAIPAGRGDSSAPPPSAPLGKVYQQIYSQPKPRNLPAVSQAPKPEPSRTHAHRRFYHHPHVHSRPAKRTQHHSPPHRVHKSSAPQTTTEIQHFRKSLAFFVPPEVESLPGQMQNLFHPQTHPEKIYSKSTPAVSQSRLAEFPQGHVHQPMHLYPQPPVTPQQGTETLTRAGTNENHGHRDKQVESAHPSRIEPQQGQMQRSFDILHHPAKSQPPRPRMLPSDILIDEPVITPAGHSVPGGSVSESPRLNSPYVPTMHCPQNCPSEFPNCCAQITFHQHLHHIVPVGLGEKDASFFYIGLPFLPPREYLDNGNGWGSPPQKPTEPPINPPTTFPSPTPASLLPWNAPQPYLQPLDGTLAASNSGNPIKTADDKVPLSLYFDPKPLNPHWSNSPESENLHKRQSPAHYIVPSNTQTSIKEPVNPVEQSELFNIQLPNRPKIHMSADDTNIPLTGNSMPLIDQYSQQQQHKATAMGRPLNNKPTDSKGSTHLDSGHELDRFLVPYSMLEDAPVAVLNHFLISNNSRESSVSGSKNLTKWERPPESYSQPKSYGLPQHGSLDGGLISFNGSSMPYRDWVHGVYTVAQNPTRHQSNLDILNDPQKSPQHIWPLEAMSTPVPGKVVYIHRSDGESSPPLFAPASEEPYLVFSPLDPSFGPELLKGSLPEPLDDLWKAWVPPDISQTFPLHDHGKIVRQSLAARRKETD